MQCWPLCSCLTDVYVCTWIPFPAPVSASQERGPEYSQPDMVMTAAPFRSYMTLLVQALLLKLVRITLPYLGNPHPKSSSSREGSRAGRCHLTRPMESVFHTTALCPFSLFGFVLWVWYQSGWSIGNVQTSFLITSQPLPSFCGNGRGPFRTAGLETWRLRAVLSGLGKWGAGQASQASLQEPTQAHPENSLQPVLSSPDLCKDSSWAFFLHPCG